mmetsp:Transcript_14385/g.26723  ORF Transcript_14385/g.26723 Transcript_14385/m.26723 type:complete len:261 (+) Transcript_14385:1-783(+)
MTPRQTPSDGLPGSRITGSSPLGDDREENREGQSPEFLHPSHDFSAMSGSLPVAAAGTEDFTDAQRAAGAQRVFEAVQVGLAVQSRRHERCLEQMARTEVDMSNLARQAVKAEDAMEKERQERQATLGSVSRQVEDTLLTCEALRRAQEHLNARLERREAPLREVQERVGCNFQELRQKVVKLRHVALEPAKAAAQMSQRLKIIEPAMEESRRLWLETMKLRGSEEQHDFQVATVQGQIDALTKLVTQRLRSSQAAGAVR